MMTSFCEALMQSFEEPLLNHVPAASRTDKEKTMFNLLADLADRYTEPPDHQPEVTMFKFFNRLAGRACRAARELTTHGAAVR